MRRTFAGFVFAVCLAGGSTRAAEVVEFADGRYLEVRSHTVLGDYIRLEVPSGSYLVFPVARVDEIRHERRLVYRYPTLPPSDREPFALGEPRRAPDPTASTRARASTDPASGGGSGS